MTPVFNPRMLVPGVVIALALFFAGLFFFLNSGGKKISVKFFLAYTIITVVAFALISLTAFITIERPVLFFAGSQGLMLLAGTIHAIALANSNKREEENVFWHELVFSLYVALLGGFVYFMIFSRIAKQTEYSLFMMYSLIAFFVPFLVYKTFEFLIAIPAEEYEKWYYPLDISFDDVDEDKDFDERQTVVLKLNVVGQRPGETNLVHTAMVAPQRWEFGRWYAFLLVTRNEAKPGEKIEYTDEFGQPHGWYFYVKGKWYQSMKLIDPKLTVSENELTGKELIICERA